MTREEAIEYLQANMPDTYYEKLREAVQIAIEALKQPEQKKAKWINKEHKMIGPCPCCTNCGGFNPIETRYCPNCGAKMSVEEQGDEE